MRVVGDEEGDVGAEVLWLLPGGAADRAGIRVGDKVGMDRGLFTQFQEFHIKMD